MKKNLFLILLCFILLLSGCSKEDETTNPNFGGEIHLFAYTPDTLNPLATAYKTNAALLTSVLYKTPVIVNPDFSVSPVLADKWSFSNNGYICTMQFKPNILFSDGTVLTAEHVRTSLEEAKKHPENLYYAISDYVESASASGNTLILKLKKPGTGVLTAMNFPVLKDTDSRIGCGLYTISGADKDGLTLKAVTSEDAAFKPNIETVHIRYYPKAEMWATGFLSSETDIIAADMTTLSKLTSKTNVTTLDFTTNKFTYLGFNMDSSVIPDANARKAIGYFMDKDTLINSLFVGYAVKTNTPFKPDTQYANLYKGDFNANPELAREYLKSSSASNLNFSILINEESITKKRIADYLSAKLNESGMQVTVSSLPYADYLQKIQDGDYTVYIGEVNTTADQDFSFLLHSAQNNLHYSSSYMDELLNHFSAETNEKQKKIYAQEIQKQILEQVPIISLYYETNVFMASEKIQSTFSPTPDNLYNGLDTWIAK